jgi:hypothetical protein
MAGCRRASYVQLLGNTMTYFWSRIGDLINDVIASRPVGAHIVAILMSLHYDFSFFQYGSAAFLTVYLSRRVVHVSEFKDWKSEPISQKTSPTPVLARCT